jgi:hypothetical protein
VTAKQHADTVRRWEVSDRADPRGVALADRHYNRQSHGSPQFVPPGRNLCFVTTDSLAVWTTSWPYAEYVRHAWAGAWVNSIFRNEGPVLSSELILEAIACTRWTWEPPDLGIVTFVDASKVRRKRDPGRCYRRAGFEHVGYTKGGLFAFQLLPEAMPEPLTPLGTQERLEIA